MLIVSLTVSMGSIGTERLKFDEVVAWTYYFNWTRYFVKLQFQHNLSFHILSFKFVEVFIFKETN